MCRTRGERVTRVEERRCWDAACEMNFLKKTTVKEEAKKAKREVGRSQRELEREKNKLEAEEKRLTKEIQRAAKKGGGGGGNNGQVKILAKQLVQVRNAKTKLLQMHGNLGAVKTNMTMMAANETMATNLKKTGEAMSRANKVMNPQKLTKTMVEFERNMEKMNINEEMMNDTLSMLDDEDEEEADAITRQVLDEIGVNLDSELASAPTSNVASRTSVQAEAAKPSGQLEA